MLEHGTKTIHQELKINGRDYDIIAKVEHDKDSAPSVSITVNDENSFFHMDVSGIDITEAHIALNEIVSAFRTLTGVSCQGPAPVAAPAVAMSPSLYNR